MNKPAATPALTGLLGEIEQIVGLRAALQLAAAASGRKLYVPLPDNLTEGHWLVAAIGLERARKVADHLTAGSSGNNVVFPLGPNGSRAKRWAAVQAALANGSSVNQVVKDHGLHERTIRRHRSGETGATRISDKRQRGLFDRD